jgi:hypothetical protein
LTPVRARDSRASTSRGRIFALASCCAAVVVAGLVLLTSHDRRPSVPVDLASAELVGRWTAGVTDPSVDESALDEDLDFDAEADDDTLSAPDWLLAAIQLSAESTDQPADPRLQDGNL